MTRKIINGYLAKNIKLSLNSNQGVEPHDHFVKQKFPSLCKARFFIYIYKPKNIKLLFCKPYDILVYHNK